MDLENCYKNPMLNDGSFWNILHDSYGNFFGNRCIKQILQSLNVEIVIGMSVANSVVPKENVMSKQR